MHDGESINDEKGRVFPCRRCGGDLLFDIASQQLKCQSCHTIHDLTRTPDTVSENDYRLMLSQIAERRGQGEVFEEHQEVRCDSCGANVLFEGTLTSQFCPYCGNSIQRNKIHRGGFRVPVDGVLSFLIEQNKAKAKLQEWVSSRWFAPNDFKKTALSEHFQGVYLPFWTYDAITHTRYEGERGDRYTQRVGNSRVRKIRWRFRKGEFTRFFDDVLVLGVNGLPLNRVTELEPWPLDNLTSFSHGFLAGHFARTYEIDVEDGFKHARVMMEASLETDCKKRIGGDEQRLRIMKWQCDAVTYKLILLPLWLVAYQYRDKSYRVFINATTGKTSGDRPWSYLKIAAASLAVGILVLLALIFIQGKSLPISQPLNF